MAKKQHTIKSLDVVSVTIGGERLVTEVDKEYKVSEEEVELFSQYPHFFEIVKASKPKEVEE